VAYIDLTVFQGYIAEQNAITAAQNALLKDPTTPQAAAAAIAAAAAAAARAAQIVPAPVPYNPNTPGITQTPYPWGFRTPAEWMALGYHYENGRWVTAGGVPGSDLTAPGAQVVSSASPLPAGPRPTALALSNVSSGMVVSFVGGTLEQVRLTTGIGAGEDGALTPIREGIAGIPRIMIDEVST
jgi:hypothetical protein